MDGPTEQDRKIQIDAPDRENRNRLLAVRLIIEATSHPEVQFSVEELAEKTGLSRWQVRQVLASDEMADLLTAQCHNRLMPLFTRAMEKIGRMLERPDATPTFMLRAGKFFLDAMQQLPSAADREAALDAEVKSQAVLAKLEATQKLLGTKVKILGQEDSPDSRERGSPDHPPGESSGANGGGSHPPSSDS